jgi:4-hydroxybenzoate polyprenyltransferase
MTVLLAYARERLTAGRLLPAVLLVVFAALAGRGWPGAAITAADAAAAVALVIAFRIWDDLASREDDRPRHPDRVVVRASSTAALQSAAWTLGIAAAALLELTRGALSVVLLAGYSGVLAATYAARGPRTTAGDRILLLKYAVFTLALIGIPGAFGVRGLLSAVAAFLAACVYEWMHDAESPVFSFGGSR